MRCSPPVSLHQASPAFNVHPSYHHFYLLATRIRIVHQDWPQCSFRTEISIDYWHECQRWKSHLRQINHSATVYGQGWSLSDSLKSTRVSHFFHLAVSNHLQFLSRMDSAKVKPICFLACLTLSGTTIHHWIKWPRWLIAWSWPFPWNPMIRQVEPSFCSVPWSVERSFIAYPTFSFSPTIYFTVWDCFCFRLDSSFELLGKSN